MKHMAVVPLFIALLAGCKTTENLAPVSQIAPSVAKEGSLANETLAADTKAGLEEVINNAIASSELLKFVIQQPVGEVGSRAWREMWIVKSSKGTYKFLITFTESGLDAANFEIKPMGSDSKDAPCPANKAQFPIGITTSEQVLRCMGKPQHENYNPDGRFVYLYESKQNLILTYLFSPDKKLLKIVGYEKTDR